MPCASDYQTARIAKPGGQSIVDLPRHFERTGIHPFWPIEGDGGDLVGHVNGDGFVGHVFCFLLKP
jgi:hypothetical protein